MRLAIDAMGGDDAPDAMVAGTVDYVSAHPDHHVVLVGQQAAIEASFSKQGLRRSDNISIVHAAEVIGMADKMQTLRERSDNSMTRCAELLKKGEVEAIVLCGNTACSVAAAQLQLRRIRGVKRAGIVTPLPTIGTPTWVIDCGANSVGKPQHLMQFAQMADAFLSRYEPQNQRRVGLLNIGSEDGKGDEMTAETLGLLRNSALNVIGNVEGNDIYKGTVDIVVCDGFTGNVVLKTSEGVASAITKILKEEIKKSWLSMAGAALMRKAFGGLRRRVHWAEVGGCLLLGVNGITVIGHGRSDRVAVASALNQAGRCVRANMLDHLVATLAPDNQPSQPSPNN